MAKRIARVNKSKSASKSVKNKCRLTGCRMHTAYMKRNKRTGDMDYWCAPHWKSEVEAKNPDDYKDQHKEIVVTKDGPRVRPRRKVRIKK